MMMKNSHKELIDRSQHRLISKLKSRPVCPFCHNEMCWRFSVVVFEKGDFPYRDEQWWRCVNCRAVQIFVVPISKEEYYREIKDRGGQILMSDEVQQDQQMLKYLKTLEDVD